jgi:hypothetical protein
VSITTSVSIFPWGLASSCVEVELDSHPSSRPRIDKAHNILFFMSNPVKTEGLFLDSC